jgi:outer membrane protein assembly factor BamB
VVKGINFGINQSPLFSNLVYNQGEIITIYKCYSGGNRMNERVRAITCPSCGAPIGIPEGSRRLFVCEFCGSTLEDQTTPEERETGSFPRIIIHSTASVTTAKPLTPKQRKRARRITWFLLLVIIVPIVVGVGVVLLTSGALVIGGQDLAAKLSPPKIYSFGVSHLLPGENGTQPGIIAVARYADETKRMVYVDFDSDPPHQWVSEPLGEGADYAYNTISQDQTHIYLVNEATLSALNRSDGTINWQVTLSDEISTNCQKCLQVYGDILVALTTDGQINGIDSQGGGTIWGLRLNTTPRQLMNISGRVGVIDEENDEVGIHVYSPETGEFLQRIVPVCPNEVFPNSPQTLGIYDPVFISSDGEKLYIPIHGYDPGCLQYWDAASLVQGWETPIPDEVLDTLDWGTFLFTDDVLYTSDGSNLYNINLADGGFGTIHGNPDYGLTPIDAQGDFVLVLSERTRGTTQYSLLGIDTRSMDNCRRNL